MPAHCDPLSNRGLNEHYAKNKMEKLSKKIHLDSLSPLAHTFLMDISMNVFGDTFKNIELTQEAQQVRQDWDDAYHWFFKKVWLNLTKEQGNHLIDLYDEFDAAMEHPLYIAKIAVMEIVNCLSLKEQECFANMYICNRLALDAQIFHRGAYLTPSGRQEAMDPDINKVLAMSKRYADMSKFDMPVTEQKMKRVHDAEKALRNAYMRWFEQNCKDELERVGRPVESIKTYKYNPNHK